MRKRSSDDGDESQVLDIAERENDFTCYTWARF